MDPCPLEIQKSIYGPGAGPPMILHGDDYYHQDNQGGRRRPKKKRRTVSNKPPKIPLHLLLATIKRQKKIGGVGGGGGPETSPPSASTLPGDFPPEYAYRALAAYSLLRTLSVPLRLSPFTPNVFLRSLYLPYPNKLTGQIHVTLLKILLPTLQMGYTYKPRGGVLGVAKKRHIDSIRWELRAGDNLTYLDSASWPLFFDDYCHLTADKLWAAMHDTDRHVDFRYVDMQPVGMMEYEEKTTLSDLESDDEDAEEQRKQHMMQMQMQMQQRQMQQQQQQRQMQWQQQEQGPRHGAPLSQFRGTTPMHASSTGPAVPTPSSSTATTTSTTTPQGGRGRGGKARALPTRRSGSRKSSRRTPVAIQVDDSDVEIPVSESDYDTESEDDEDFVAPIPRKKMRTGKTTTPQNKSKHLPTTTPSSSSSLSVSNKPSATKLSAQGSASSSAIKKEAATLSTKTPMAAAFASPPPNRTSKVMDVEYSPSGATKIMKSIQVLPLTTTTSMTKEPHLMDTEAPLVRSSGDPSLESSPRTGGGKSSRVLSVTVVQPNGQMVDVECQPAMADSTSDASSSSKNKNKKTGETTLMAANGEEPAEAIASSRNNSPASSKGSINSTTPRKNQRRMLPLHKNNRSAPPGGGSDNGSEQAVKTTPSATVMAGMKRPRGRRLPLHSSDQVASSPSVTKNQTPSMAVPQNPVSSMPAHSQSRVAMMQLQVQQQHQQQQQLQFQQQIQLQQQMQMQRMHQARVNELYQQYGPAAIGMMQGMGQFGGGYRPGFPGGRQQQQQFPPGMMQQLAMRGGMPHHHNKNNMMMMASSYGQSQSMMKKGALPGGGHGTSTGFDEAGQFARFKSYKVSDPIADALERFTAGQPIPAAEPQGDEDVESVSSTESYREEFGYTDDTDDQWSHFRPLEAMRDGVPYHRLPLGQKLDILEFLLDELLTVDVIAAEFSKRSTISGCYGFNYGPLPTEAEFDALENNDECGVCGAEGDLLCCDGCVNSYHRACLDMSNHQVLPDGKWLCPECKVVDPSNFGTLRGGQKASLDWFTIEDVLEATRRSETTAAANGVVVPNINSGPFVPLHHQTPEQPASTVTIEPVVATQQPTRPSQPPTSGANLPPGEQGGALSTGIPQEGDVEKAPASDLALLQAQVAAAAAAAAESQRRQAMAEAKKKFEGMEFLVVHGFVFSRTRQTKDVDKSLSKQPCFALSHDQVKIYLRELGVTLSTSWPIAQIPSDALSSSDHFPNLQNYLLPMESFDPSFYISKYRNAPQSPWMKTTGSQHKNLFVSEFETECSQMNTFRVTDALARDMTYDKHIAENLRTELSLFDPYSSIKTYMLKLEGTLKKACLLSEFWETGKRMARCTMWQSNVRKCKSIGRLASLFLNLVDQVHHRAFQEGWFYNTYSKHTESSPVTVSERSYLPLANDWTPEMELKIRRWQKAPVESVRALLATEGRPLEDLCHGFRSDLSKPAVSKQGKRKKQTGSSNVPPSPNPKQSPQKLVCDHAFRPNPTVHGDISDPPVVSQKAQPSKDDEASKSLPESRAVALTEALPPGSQLAAAAHVTPQTLSQEVKPAANLSQDVTMDMAADSPLKAEALKFIEPAPQILPPVAQESKTAHDAPPIAHQATFPQSTAPASTEPQAPRNSALTSPTLGMSSILRESSSSPSQAVSKPGFKQLEVADAMDVVNEVDVEVLRGPTQEQGLLPSTQSLAMKAFSPNLRVPEIPDGMDVDNDSGDKGSTMLSSEKGSPQKEQLLGVSEDPGGDAKADFNQLVVADATDVVNEANANALDGPTTQGQGHLPLAQSLPTTKGPSSEHPDLKFSETALKQPHSNQVEHADSESGEIVSTNASAEKYLPPKDQSLAVSEEKPVITPEVRSEAQNESSVRCKHQNAAEVLDVGDGGADKAPQSPIQAQGLLQNIEVLTNPTFSDPELKTQSQDEPKAESMTQNVSDEMVVDEGEQKKPPSHDDPQHHPMEGDIDSNAKPPPQHPSESQGDAENNAKVDTEVVVGSDPNVKASKDGSAKKRSHKSKKAKAVGEKGRTRRSGRIQTRHTTDEDLGVPSSLSATDIPEAARVELSGMDLVVEEQKKAKISELEKLARGVFLKDIPWPVAGRIPFATLGNLPPHEMKRLARKAGAVHAPHVIYFTAHEVGQVCLAHMWRKKTQQCNGLEELLHQIRIFESFLDRSGIHSCENLAKRTGAKAQIQKVIKCTQRDPSTGIVHHFVVNQGRMRGCWISSEVVDLSPLILDRSQRRERQVKKHAARMQVIALAEAEKARVLREAEAARKAKARLEAAEAARKARLEAAEAARAAKAKRDAEIARKAKAKRDAEAARKAEQARVLAEARARAKALAAQQQANAVPAPPMLPQHTNAQRYPGSLQAGSAGKKRKSPEKEIAGWNKEIQLALNEHEKQVKQLLKSCVARGTSPQIASQLKSLRKNTMNRMVRAAAGLARCGLLTANEKQLNELLVSCEKRAIEAMKKESTGTQRTEPGNSLGSQRASQNPEPASSRLGVPPGTQSEPNWSTPVSGINYSTPSENMAASASLGSTYHQAQTPGTSYGATPSSQSKQKRGGMQQSSSYSGIDSSVMGSYQQGQKNSAPPDTASIDYSKLGGGASTSVRNSQNPSGGPGFSIQGGMYYQNQNDSPFMDQLRSRVNDAATSNADTNANHQGFHGAPGRSPFASAGSSSQYGVSSGSSRQKERSPQIPGYEFELEPRPLHNVAGHSSGGNARELQQMGRSSSHRQQVNGSGVRSIEEGIPRSFEAMSAPGSVNATSYGTQYPSHHHQQPYNPYGNQPQLDFQQQQLQALQLLQQQEQQQQQAPATTFQQQTSVDQLQQFQQLQPPPPSFPLQTPFQQQQQQQQQQYQQQYQQFQQQYYQQQPPHPPRYF